MEQYIWFNNQSYYCFNDTLKIMKTFQGFPDPETTHDSMEIGQSYMLGQEESNSLILVLKKHEFLLSSLSILDLRCKCYIAYIAIQKYIIV